MAAQQQQAALHAFAQQVLAQNQDAEAARRKLPREAPPLDTSQAEHWPLRPQQERGDSPVTLFRPRARRAEAKDQEALLAAASCGPSQGSGKSSQSLLGSAVQDVLRPQHSQSVQA